MVPFSMIFLGEFSIAIYKVPQKDIVFLVCDALEIVNAGIPYCFTDGNATKAISKFYNTLYGLRELDWPCIRVPYNFTVYAEALVIGLERIGVWKFSQEDTEN